jgi:hypothetical protein
VAADLFLKSLAEIGVQPDAFRYTVMNGGQTLRGVIEVNGSLHHAIAVSGKPARVSPAPANAAALRELMNLRKSFEYEWSQKAMPPEGPPASTSEDEAIRQQHALATDVHPGAETGGVPDDPASGDRWHTPEPAPQPPAAPPAPATPQPWTPTGLRAIPPGTQPNPPQSPQPTAAFPGTAALGAPPAAAQPFPGQDPSLYPPLEGSLLAPQQYSELVRIGQQRNPEEAFKSVPVSGFGARPNLPTQGNWSHAQLLHSVGAQLRERAAAERSYVSIGIQKSFGGIGAISPVVPTQPSGMSIVRETEDRRARLRQSLEALRKMNGG